MCTRPWQCILCRTIGNRLIWKYLPDKNKILDNIKACCWNTVGCSVPLQQWFYFYQSKCFIISNRNISCVAEWGLWNQYFWNNASVLIILSITKLLVNFSDKIYIFYIDYDCSLVISPSKTAYGNRGKIRWNIFQTEILYSKLCLV